MSSAGIAKNFKGRRCVTRRLTVSLLGIVYLPKTGMIPITTGTVYVVMSKLTVELLPVAIWYRLK
eukprot:scaffold2109_cov188-Amphora_coffeaeformis.AAC.10